MFFNFKSVFLLFLLVHVWRLTFILRKNKYGLFLCFILILEISSAVVVYLNRNYIVETVEENMFNSMQKYNEDMTVTQSWDFVQNRLQCCGVHQIQDWKSKEINGIEVQINNETFNIPGSCCSFPNCEVAYEKGCLDHLSYIISECAFILGSGAICVAIVQILGIAFAHMLAKAIRHIKTKEEMIRQQERQRIYNDKNSPFLYTPTFTDI